MAVINVELITQFSGPGTLLKTPRTARLWAELTVS